MDDTSFSPRDWREARRFRAFALKEKGWKQRKIAEALGVSDAAVSQWIRRVQEGGAETLRHSPAPGATCRLQDEQIEQIKTFIKEGASAHGFRGERWTGKRVARLIKTRFGISYHPNYVPTLLKGWGFSLQRPVKKARQQNEEAAVAFRAREFAEIKKSASRIPDDRAGR